MVDQLERVPGRKSGTSLRLSASTRSGKRPVHRPQAQRRTEMQRRLLDAAIRLLIDRGYSEFRTADVARVAKVSRGAQLHHFRTKDALVVAALEDLYRSTTEASEKRLADAGSSLDIRHLVQDSEAYYYGEEFLASVDVVISARHNRALADKVANIAAQYRYSVEEKWAQAFAKKGISLDVARDAVWLIHTVLRGMRFRKSVKHSARQVMRVTNLAQQLTEEFIATTERRRNNARRVSRASDR
jgi:AcrR family transcriptional regulator